MKRRTRVLQSRPCLGSVSGSFGVAEKERTHRHFILGKDPAGLFKFQPNSRSPSEHSVSWLATHIVTEQLESVLC